jgi:hypothetical protein
MALAVNAISCPNPDMGPDDVQPGQMWTHDNPTNPSHRDLVWAVEKIDRDTGDVLLFLLGHPSTVIEVPVGNLLAHWMCRVKA